MNPTKFNPGSRVRHRDGWTGTVVLHDEVYCPVRVDIDGGGLGWANCENLTLIPPAPAPFDGKPLTQIAYETAANLSSRRYEYTIYSDLPPSHPAIRQAEAVVIAIVAEHERRIGLMGLIASAWASLPPDPRNDTAAQGELRTKLEKFEAKGGGR